MVSTNTNGKTVVIAHRGGSQLFLENTLTAFKKVQELGVDAIEIDVHPTKDGKLVVIHDPDLNRIAGIDKFVSDMTFEEISNVELPGGEHIPELQEVLDIVHIPLVIELKSPETLKALTEIFRKNSGSVSRCVVISFFHDTLKMLKDQFPTLETGALLVGFPSDPLTVARSCGSSVLSFHFEGLTRDYVERCHRDGLKVSVWTPNTEEEIAAVLATGVDSIASDRPDLVLKALKR